MKGIGHTEIIKGLMLGGTLRDIYVYLPPGTGPFPLILTHDGQFIFDILPSPDHLDIGTIMNSLLESEKVEPVIVVSIESTVHRLKTLEPWHHHEYVDFIENTLLPLLMETYPIRHPFYTVGFSAGGQMALYLTLAKCIFDSAFAILPLWNPPMETNLPCENKEVYILVDSKERKKHLSRYLPTNTHIEVDTNATHSIDYFRNILPHAIQVLMKHEKSK